MGTPKILTKRKCFNLNDIKYMAKPCILHYLLIVVTFPSPVEEKNVPLTLTAIDLIENQSRRGRLF